MSKRLDVGRVILKELSRGSVGRTELEGRVTHGTGVSHAVFDGMFVWLVRDGDIEKCSGEHLAPFRITKKGEAGLVWRAMP